MAIRAVSHGWGEKCRMSTVVRRNVSARNALVPDDGQREQRARAQLPGHEAQRGHAVGDRGRPASAARERRQRSSGPATSATSASDGQRRAARNPPGVARRPEARPVIDVGRERQAGPPSASASADEQRARATSSSGNAGGGRRGTRGVGPRQRAAVEHGPGEQQRGDRQHEDRQRRARPAGGPAGRRRARRDPRWPRASGSPDGDADRRS